MSDAVQRGQGQDTGGGEATEDSTRQLVAEEDVTAQASPEALTRAAAGGVPAPGQTLAGRYTVLQLLGEGGMGVVLAAYDARLDRRVALKLMHARPGVGTHSQEVRMVREAQAMARLSHPNVVAVYDAGTLEDGAVFIAMELVQGLTLKAWCRQQPRAWDEVLRVYLAAGRGLEAAHAAGLVHRDFKPDNVLVGEDGRVRVTDFGVARVDTSSPSAETPALAALTAPSEAWETPLTQVGMVVGTPRYLAPELLRLQPADARSDLFSFCVALYEALYGQLPFTGSTVAERLEAQREGRVQPPPAHSQVPGWLGQAVLRGLALAPHQRPASMGALLALLQDDPAQRRRERRRTLAQGGGALALVGLTLALGGVYQRQQQQVCGQMERRLEGVWDEPLRQRVRQAFLATGAPYAQGTYERVEAALEDYARKWVARRKEVCEALRTQGARAPDSLAVLEERCLERRRGQLRTLTALLTEGVKRTWLPKAVEMARSLPSLEYCSDAQALTAAVPPPEDPVVRSRVEALQQEVDQLEALSLAGRYKEGLARGERLLESLEALDYAPLRARALLELAHLQEQMGDYKAAEALLRQSILLAARGKDVVLAASAWTRLLGVVGISQVRFQDAQALQLGVDAAVEHANDDKARGISILHQGSMLRKQGRYEEALAHYERVVALFDKVRGPEHPSVLSAHALTATVLTQMGRHEQAWTRFEQILALQERVLGPDHPALASTLNNLGLTLISLGRYAEAQARLERSLRLREQLLGPEHPELGGTLNNLGLLELDRGRYEQARAYCERSLAIKEKALGPEHLNVASSHSSLGQVLWRQGRHGEALARLERALALRQKALGPDNPQLAGAHAHVGRVLVSQGKLEAAGRQLERALALAPPREGKDPPELEIPLLALGELRLAQGRPDEAIAALERALPLASGAERASARFLLARTLWEAGRDRPRALELARQSLEEWRSLGHVSLPAEVSGWLAERQGP